MNWLLVINFVEQTYLVNAIVLDKQPWREADAKVFLYTRERGRLDLVVRGARKISSKLNSHLEPYNQVAVMVVLGQNYNTVGGVQSLGSGCLSTDYDQLKAAGQLVALWLELTKEGLSEPLLYDLLADYLVLNRQRVLPPVTARYLAVAGRLRALQLLGLLSDGRECNSCGGRLATAAWLKSSGELLCRSCRPMDSAQTLELSTRSVQLLQLLAALSFKEAVRQGRLETSALLRLEQVIAVVCRNQH